MKTLDFSIVVVVVLGITLSLPSEVYAFDKPIYTLHYTGLDTIPVVYGSCMPLTVYDHYPASIVVMEAASHCTAYSDQACQTSLTSDISVKAGSTGLEELGDAFSMENFMSCTLDGYDDTHEAV